MADAEDQVWSVKINNEWSPNGLKLWQFRMFKEIIDFLKNELEEVKAKLEEAYERT